MSIKKVYTIGLCIVLILLCSGLQITRAEIVASNNHSISTEDLSIAQEHLYMVYQKCAGELTEAEQFAFPWVHDAIATMNLSNDQVETSYRRLMSVNSPQQLSAILCGYFDVNDPSYVQDHVIFDRLGEIISTCGLEPSEYLLSVTKNIPGYAYPNWYCVLGRMGIRDGEEDVGVQPIKDFHIIISGEDLKVVSFSMNAH